MNEPLALPTAMAYDGAMENKEVPMGRNEQEPRTIHVIGGTRYKGAFTEATVTPLAETPEWADGTIHGGTAEGHVLVRSAANDAMVVAGTADVFLTEAGAREAARARRKPRQPRQARGLYGDFATIAMLNGISTDGTGRRVR